MINMYKPDALFPRTTYIVFISSDIFVKFSPKFNQNWKIAKSDVGSNIVQNDSKWSLLVISNVNFVHFSQNFQ